MDILELLVKHRKVMMLFILMLASIIILIVLGLAQMKKDHFDLRWLVVDEKTHRPSIHKLGQGCALVVSTWGFVYLIINDRFTETYFLIYMGWAGIEAVNQFIANRSRVPPSISYTDSSTAPNDNSQQENTNEGRNQE